MDNFKTYLFNGPVMQNFGKLLSLPADAGSSQRDLTPPLPHMWSDHSQAHQGLLPATLHQSSLPTAPITVQLQNPMHFDFPWGYSRTTKFKMCLKLFIDLVSKSFTAHYEMVYFKIWIKLFHARPKTSFPPQRAFSFPGPSQAPAGSWEPRAGHFPAQGTLGFHCWVLTTGAAATPALPAPATLLAQKTSRYLKNINNHFDSTQMLLCDIAALNNMS